MKLVIPKINRKTSEVYLMLSLKGVIASISGIYKLIFSHKEIYKWIEWMLNITQIWSWSVLNHFISQGFQDLLSTNLDYSVTIIHEF